MKLCECGCGLKTSLAQRTDTAHGRVKGEFNRFVFGHHARVVVTKSHRQIGPKGTVLHRIIATKALGRELPSSAQVHHVDENPWAMNPRLVICQDHAYHKLLHVRARIVRAGGNPNTDKFCGDCGRPKPLQEFNTMRANKSTGRQSVCRDCQREREHAKRRAA